MNSPTVQNDTGDKSPSREASTSLVGKYVRCHQCGGTETRVEIHFENGELILYCGHHQQQASTEHFVTLAPGGTKERKVKLESLEIRDLWHIGNDLGGYGGDAVIEVWHLAHDLKTALIEVWAMLDNTTTTALEMTTQRNLLLESCKSVRGWFSEWNVEVGPAEEALLEPIDAAIARAEGK